MRWFGIKYVINLIAIQSSKLSAKNKQRLCTKLTGLWLSKIKPIDSFESRVETTFFLQERIANYKNAMDDGKGRDWTAAL